MTDDRFLSADFIGRRNWPTLSFVWHPLKRWKRIRTVAIITNNILRRGSRQRCNDNGVTWHRIDNMPGEITTKSTTTRHFHHELCMLIEPSAGLRLWRPWCTQKNEAPCPNFEIPSNRCSVVHPKILQQYYRDRFWIYYIHITNLKMCILISELS